MSIFTSLSCKIYNLTPKTTVLPAFLDKFERKKLLEADESYHLIQEGFFPHVATTLRISPDQKFVLATGSYPHQVRMFDLENSSVKFQRNQMAETVDSAFLGPDWRKFALVLDDKTVEIHGQKGKIFGAKVQKPPRTLCYDAHEASLVVGGSSPELNVLDLFAGRFRPNLQLKCDFVNQITYDRNLELLFAATNAGVSAVDQRTRGVIGHLATPSPATSVCACRQLVAVGLEASQVLIYDVRSSVPMAQLEQHTHAVKQVEFVSYADEKYLVSADMCQIRVFDSQFKAKFNIEPGYAIHKFQRFDQSGLLAVACDHKFINFFYAPDLGPAPAFAKDLDQQLLNLDVQQQAGEFANYKFVTRSELEALGLVGLIESGQIITYMHGFYIPKQLYREQVQKDMAQNLRDRKQKEANISKDQKKVISAKKDDRFAFE